ncbi:MAG: hypothetical protein CME21_06315 [Gemmatimonadetes bacterium]|nr:hypothetical protein [Gemmatimonadota bacterium]
MGSKASGLVNRGIETVLGIVRARMTASRLPGKVLMEALDRPLLMHMVDRLGACRLIRNVVVATTSEASDNPIEAFCRAEGIEVFRGSANDVLDRIYRCAKAYDSEHAALLGADNPLIDPVVCEEVIGAYLSDGKPYDYVSNHHPPTYPDGQDIEVFRVAALEEAWREADRPFQREHVTPFIWDQPDRFRCHNVALDQDRHKERWTLDYEEDYVLIRRIIEGLYAEKPGFTMLDIVDFLDRHPELRGVNSEHSGYTWYDESRAELTTVFEDDTEKREQ